MINNENDTLPHDMESLKPVDIESPVVVDDAPKKRPFLTTWFAVLTLLSLSAFGFSVYAVTRPSPMGTAVGVFDTTSISSNFGALFSSMGNKKGKDKPITQEECLKAIETWGKGLVAIATAYDNDKDYVQVAKDGIKALYAYDLPGKTVLFKPTLADIVTFRTNEAAALSYFVGPSAPNHIPEDTGFAIKHWSKTAFEIAGFILGEKQAIIMGNKLLTQKDGKLTKANFSMGFIRDPKTGKLKINLHHSSLPYTPAPK